MPTPAKHVLRLHYAWCRSNYREAVTQHSPGLPRSGNPGTRPRIHPVPQRGCVAIGAGCDAIPLGDATLTNGPGGTSFQVATRSATGGDGRAVREGRRGDGVATSR
jgi:hypothetical protein